MRVVLCLRSRLFWKLISRYSQIEGASGSGKTRIATEVISKCMVQIGQTQTLATWHKMTPDPATGFDESDSITAWQLLGRTIMNVHASVPLVDSHNDCTEH